MWLKSAIEMGWKEAIFKWKVHVQGEKKIDECDYKTGAAVIYAMVSKNTLLKDDPLWNSLWKEQSYADAIISYCYFPEELSLHSNYAFHYFMAHVQGKLGICVQTNDLTAKAHAYRILYDYWSLGDIKSEQIYDYVENLY